MNRPALVNENKALECPWLSAAYSVLPWIIPAALSLYIKYRMLSGVLHGGFRIVARSLGRTPSASASGLSLWEMFSFFRADLLVAFLVVPLGLVVLCRYLPSRGRRPFVVLLSVAISIVLYCQLRAFEEVGQFLSLDMFRAAITWGLQNPTVSSRYLNVGAFLALAAAIAMAWVWHWRAKRENRSPLNPVAARHGYIGSAVVASCLAVLTIMAWASPLPATPFHESILVWVLRSLSNRTDVDTREFRDLSAEGLENRYRAMTSAPAWDRDTRYWGKAKGCNVLFLVLETAPAKVLPADGDLADFPNLRRLREASFVGISHYTTYPETHQAIFSIFSSWYPSSFVDFNRQHPDLVAPGIIRKLSELGYDTAIYSPYDFRGESDADMYRELGFQRQVYNPKKIRIVLKVFQTSLETRMALDTAVLSLLKQDLERDIAEGRQFAYLFAPQVSHGPWLGLDLKRNGEEQDIAKQGRHLLGIPDQWLGEIMQLLERHDQLKQTVIVVVGDHGIRTRKEDPSFAGGIFGDYSFHVPLVIYAPKALNHREKIPWITSHIDIAPTVLGLLGVERSFEQGTPIWDPHLAKRTTYFFARSLAGADGYHSNGRFFMWSHVSDAVYENTRMSFDAVPPVPRGSSVYDEVTSSIRRMAGLEEVWATRLSQAKSVRNHLYDPPSR
jgi:membrane-anchored protein YejM (alkaline phosphatase superfamily)